MMRHRAELVEMTSQHIQHMHKALTQMNVQIHHVISDLTGVTGLAIIDAIIAGERNPAVLAKLRDPHIKGSEETIRKSLVGNWRAEHLFTLKQSRQSYQHYQEQITTCDEEIEKMVVAFVARVDPAEKPLPRTASGSSGDAKRRTSTPGQASICGPNHTSCSVWT